MQYTYYINYCVFSIEFSFLTRYYYLLYQSLIPNGRLAIATLRQHCHISSVTEQYIVGGGNLRLSSQRLLNFLITNLEVTRDHVKFCYYLEILSVLTDLPGKITAGIMWMHELTVHKTYLNNKVPKVSTYCYHNKHFSGIYIQYLLLRHD